MLINPFFWGNSMYYKRCNANQNMLIKQAPLMFLTPKPIGANAKITGYA